MEFGLDTHTIESIVRVFKKHHNIQKVLIYGSRAKGNHKTGSDIDLVLFGKDLDEDQRKLIMQDIDDLNLPYLFDISIYDSLESQELRSHIERVGLEFYVMEN